MGAEGGVFNALLVGMGFVVYEDTAADDAASLVPVWTKITFASMDIQIQEGRRTVWGRENLICRGCILQLVNSGFQSSIGQASGKVYEITCS